MNDRRLPPPVTPVAPYVLKRTSALFLGLEIVAAIGLAIGVSFVGEEVTIEGCRWCSRNAFDEGVRRLVVADDRLWAGVWTHRLSVGFLPLLAILGTAIPALGSQRKRAALQDFAMILGAFIVTTGIAAPIKALASRERPGFVYSMLTEGSPYPTERFASFISGDTAWAFCLAAASATLAYLRGYRTARPIAVLGALAAVATGLLRIRADMHWATDVLGGALAGSLIGAGVPLALHRRAPEDVAAAKDEASPLADPMAAVAAAARASVQIKASAP